MVVGGDDDLRSQFTSTSVELAVAQVTGQRERNSRLSQEVVTASVTRSFAFEPLELLPGQSTKPISIDLHGKCGMLLIPWPLAAAH